MIIKSHIRGGFRDAAAYLKEQGKNEKTRLVEISDPHAKNLDEAFRAMWAVSDGTKVKKPLHHISINPMKDERLTDKQVLRICERLEERYGYAHGDHQRVIVEHIKDGRQHFHVIWNRVSLKTGKPHYPYMHKMQSKIAAREMEVELGLKKVTSCKTVRIRMRQKFKFSVSNFITAPAHFAGSLRPFSECKSSIPTIAPRSVTAPDPAPVLFRPPSGGGLAGMYKEQQIDFEAACEGKITWRQYFQRWGNPLANWGPV